MPKGDYNKKKAIQGKVDTKAKIEDMLSEHYLLGKGQVAQDFKLRFAQAGTDKAGKWHSIPYKIHDDDLTRADMIIKLLAADGIKISKHTLYKVLIQFGMSAVELAFKEHYTNRANELAKELAGMTDMLHPEVRQQLRKALLESSTTSTAPGTPRKHKAKSQKP